MATAATATMLSSSRGEGDHADQEANNTRERMNSTSSSTFTCASFRSTSTSSTTTTSSSSSSALLLLTRKPHKSHQADWEAIRRLRSAAGRVSLEHFRLVRRLGSGDLGNVYLCRLRDHPLLPSSSSSSPLYAMKVVDRESLAARKKLHRADTEREILSALDHPFLPTLYASFDAAHYSCLVMEFCPGGDLHVARQRQPGRRFSLSSTRFYAAEVLVALEYLHMMGIVYRDLKPENVLIRGDGHIMLSDFDLSLKCDVVPKLLKLPEKSGINPKTTSSSAAACSVTTPMQPVLSCLLGTGSRGTCRIMRTRSRTTTTTITMTAANQENSIPKTVTETGGASKVEGSRGGRGEDGEFGEEESKVESELVAEPVAARSKSFVGTHEYLAPEVISGLGHGGAVDWWTLGVFLYELLFGRTPFKGEDNEKTLINIIKQPLRFPRVTVTMASGGGGADVEEMLRAQDLISRLLVKNPKRRIGSTRGAVEIRRHEFFKGVSWALIRSVRPPEVPNAMGLHLHQHLNKMMVMGRVPNHTHHHFDYF